MKKIILAVALMTCMSTVADIVYEDPVVLQGDWVLEPSEHVYVNGGISGTGDIRYNAKNGGLGLLIYGANTAVGDIYVGNGNVYLFHQAAAGTGAIHVDSEEPAGQAKCVQVDCATTLENDFYLGSEANSGWQPRLVSAPGAGNEVIFNGAINFNATKIRIENGVARFRGGLSGSNQIALDCNNKADLYIEEKPLDMEGGTLYLQNPGRIHFNVVGHTFGAMFLQSNTRLVCGVDSCIPEVAVVPQDGMDGKTWIDLAGHSQSLGNLVFAYPAAVLTIENSDTTKTPTVTLNKTDDHLVNLHFDGPLNFVKCGAGKMSIANAIAIQGELEVRDGTLELLATPDWPAKFAESVVLTGGTLDLGGQTWRCGTLLQNGGKIVNGTLYSATNVINSARTDSDATIAGNVVLNAEGTHLLPEHLAATGSVAYAHREYSLPEGTVLYLPFDSDEKFTTDYSVSAAKMVSGPDEGMLQFVADGKCDGCAYFDGASTLVAERFPARIPSGNAPRTIGFWFKLSGAPGEASMVCWGALNTYNANVTAMRGENCGFFPWGYEGYAGKASGVNLWDGDWHHFVVAWDGTELRQYVDGFESVQTPGVALQTLAESLVLGATPQRYDGSWFKGWLDEVFILDRAASAEEAVSFYRQPFARRDVDVNAPTVFVKKGTLENRPSGAVAIWSFDDAEHLLVDATGKGHALSVLEEDGAPAFAAESPLSDGGGSLYLNGATTLTLPLFPDDMPSGAAPRTVAFFMKSDRETRSEDAMVTLGLPASPGYAFSCACRGDNVGCGLWGNDDVAWCFVGSVFQDWHSMVVTFDGTKIVYYWDGVAIREYAAPFELQTSKEFKIGSFSSSDIPYPSSYFKGWLDEVAVYDRALDPSEAISYHSQGALRRNAKLPEGASVEVAAGATLSLESASGVTIPSLSGSGTVGATVLTVTEKIQTGTAVAGDLTLADGIRICPNAAQTTVSGTLTLPENGKVTVPDWLPKSDTLLPLFGAASFAGTEGLSGWTFDGATKGRTVSLVVRDGVLYLDVAKIGFRLFLR